MYTTKNRVRYVKWEKTIEKPVSQKPSWKSIVYELLLLKPILERFGEVGECDMFAPLQIRDGTRYLQNTHIPARGQFHP